MIARLRLFAAALAVLLGAHASGQETVQLTTYRLAGKDVAAKVPASFTDAVERFAAAAPRKDTPVWRIKLFVLSSLSVATRSTNGVVRTSAPRLRTDDALGSIARAAALLQASLGPALRVEVDAEVDADSWLIEVDQGQPVVDASRMRDYLAPLLNGGGFEAEDRIDRGPFQSVLVVTGGDSTGATVVVKGSVSSHAAPDQIEATIYEHAKARLGRNDLGTIFGGAVPDFSAVSSADWRKVMAAVPAGLEREGEAAAVAPSEPAPLEAIEAAGIGADADTPTKVKLVEWLKHKDETVRLNAAIAFQRIKEPQAITHLADAAVSYSMAQGAAALRALAHQDNELAWASIRYLLRGGPTEHNKAAAAKLLAAKGNAAAMAEVSVLLTSSSWRARKAAAEAIGSFKTREAQTMNLVFLQEIHPAVRLAVTLAADPKVDLVARRLNWSAVNDSSDEVRAWSYIKLTEAEEKRFVTEGYKGVRDDSLWVRLKVLDHIRSHPSEASRAALRLAVLDPVAEVRVRAIEAWTAFPGEVAQEDLARIWDDPDPAVVKALAELASKKGIRRP